MGRRPVSYRGVPDDPTSHGPPPAHGTVPDEGWVAPETDALEFPQCLQTSPGALSEVVGKGYENSSRLRGKQINVLDL